MRRVISMLLQNEVGALGRVIGLFSARGYNIESLTVATTHDAAISRLTLVTHGDDAVISQIVKQSRKLIDVIEVVDLTRRAHLEVELLLVKVDIEPDRLVAFLACLRRHPRAQVLDIADGVRTIEFTGDGADVEKFVSELGETGEVIEIARSGTATIERGVRRLSVPV
jgi:acetolactate synthase-1/3 small subunit